MKSQHVLTIRSMLVLLVIACVLPMMLMVTVALAYFYQHEWHQLEANSLATARAMTATLDKDLAGTKSVLHVLSTSRMLDSNDLLGFYHQAQDVLQENIASSIAVIDARGDQRLNTSLPFPSTALPMNRPAALQRIFETAQPVITDLFVDPASHRHGIVIGVPVVRDNRVIFSIEANVLPERLSLLLTQQRLPPGWIAAILDSTGTIVARTHNMGRFVGHRGAENVVKRIQEVAEDTLEARSLEGLPVISVFSRSRVSNWTVAIGIPVHYLTGQLSRSIWLIIAGITVVLAGTLAMSWVIGGRIAGAFSALTEPARGRHRPLAPAFRLKEADEVGNALVRERADVEKLHAEASLKAREERDRMFNHSIDLLCVAGLDGYFKQLNPAWQQALGWSNEVLMSRAAIDFVHPEDREATNNVVKNLFEKESTFSFENRYRCSDGSYKWISWNAYRLADENNFFVSGRDITERKRVEQSLHSSEGFLNSIVENIPAMIFVKEAKELRFVRFNKAGENLLGYSREQLVGKNDYDFFPANQADFFTAIDMDVLRSKNLLDIAEESIQTHSGEVRILHTRKIPISDSEGNSQYLLGISEDITERKHAELELKSHRDQREILIQELMLAKERADVANRAKSTFLSSISHELRTPLNAILGYAQILKRGQGLSERQVLGLNTIQQSGQHLLMLINDILDLAKIEAGKLELTMSAFPLQDFLSMISDIIGIKAAQKSLRFNFEAAADLPHTVLADETRLRQILLNLLSNAVKFTDAGQVDLRVRCVSMNHTKAQLRFDIQDTGIGIDLDKSPALFRPFEQAGDLPRRAGGTGLGLAISRELVRLMDSDIHVESRIGAGSLFWFEVAVLVEDNVKLLPVQQCVTGYQGPRKTVLIVDDVEANRAMLVDLFDSLGFATCEAADGEQAVAQAQGVGPDLILMDMVMPVMDGLQAMTRIRATPGLRTIPIIAVSASATHDDQEASLAAGASAFCAKPIDQNVLLKQIGALLELDWMWEPFPSPASQRKNDIAFELPPKEEMDALYELALTGNMRDIRQRLVHLESLDQRFHPFAEKLRVLSMAYQSKAILAMVEKYRANPTAPDG
jgi:PAS domain S-box-containing protein